MPNTAQQRARSLKAQASALGFDACAIAKATVADPENRLGRWLANGFHADMHWMSATQDIRQDVSKKVASARSVVVVARNYHHPRPAAAPQSAKVAAYAWGCDYHNVLKKPLRALATHLNAMEDNARSYAAIDSGPVLERTWAERAGLGWIGKNSLLLRRDLGSWLFIATIITTIDLAADDPVSDRCGSCTRCIDACPTDAIVAPQVVDANRCISYHTIENRGDIPDALHAPMDNWIFGCDICQEVCPWNRFARTTDETDFHPRDGLANPDTHALIASDKNAFDAQFSGTPVRRAKHKGMVRNARIVAQNERDAGATQVASVGEDYRALP